MRSQSGPHGFTRPARNSGTTQIDEFPGTIRSAPGFGACTNVIG
jgi:hypothetical protein